MSDPGARDLSDVFLDLFVYAPIGLVLDAETVAPDLAKRGRQHTAAARRIGELAVKQGMRRLDEVMAQVAEGMRGDAEATSEAAQPPPATAEPRTTEPAPSSAHLAIPDYDLLAASQVVKRLDGLDAPELEAVRVYESATRDRRTILHKIARLQG